VAENEFWLSEAKGCAWLVSTCLAWQKDESALETWFADNERRRRSTLRLCEKELKILEN
jgi:hypothetical protein